MTNMSGYEHKSGASGVLCAAYSVFMAFLTSFNLSYFILLKLLILILKVLIL